MVVAAARSRYLSISDNKFRNHQKEYPLQHESETISLYLSFIKALFRRLQAAMNDQAMHPLQIGPEVQ